jgi:hypothetical protein
MDTQSNVQKRKRANTALNEPSIESEPEEETTIIVDTSHYGKPSNIEDNPDDSDADQLDDEPLEESTLF